MSILKPLHPGARILDGRLEPVDGTMSLSTPIVSVQDGPRMTTSAFGGKKAAPFTKGGGRSSTHPNDAKGRKRKAAKAAFKKRAKDGDYSNLDFAFRSSEKRDRDGKWAKGGATWLPEKGARSKAEFDSLQAKNKAAKDRLAKGNASGAALETGRKVVDGYGTPQAKQDALGQKLRTARAAFAEAQKSGSAHEVRKANRKMQRAAKHNLFHAKKYPGVRMSGGLD